MQLIETPKAKETREYRMLVGGEWVEALSSKTFESVNPYTGLVRELLVRHPLAGSAATPVYAVDTSVWPRCDAECSPERGYYYPPSRHSAGQPIVAGWAYQFVAQLNFVRESWTAPVDVERVLPAKTPTRSPHRAGEGLAGPARERKDRSPVRLRCGLYDPVKVQQGLEGSQCQILVRLRAGRRFYGDPSLCDPPEHIGRPRRHGPKMKCSGTPPAGPNPPPSIVVRTPVTDVCACGRGPRCTRRSATTQQRALEDPCPSCSGRSLPGWRSSLWRGARGGASLGFCGCGGKGRRGRCRTSMCSGVLRSGASTWSTPSAFSSRAWDGAPLGFAIPSRRIGGVGWFWPPTRSSGWRAPESWTLGCRGSAPTIGAG
jgi:hypothetical protein